MNWKRLFDCYAIPRKCEKNIGEVLLSSLAPAGLSAVGSIASSLFGQSNQAEENQKNRDFALEMWNKTNEYNTPLNQRKRLEEAGYNPYLFASDASAAGQSVQPSSPSTSPLPNFDMGMDSASRILQNGLQVEANQEEQHSKAISNMVRVAIDAYKELGYKGYKDVMDAFSPVLANIDFQGSRADVVFENQLQNWLSQRYNMDMDSFNKEITYYLGKKYGEQQIQSNLEKLQYDISEIVGRLNTMSVQNEATIKQTAADMLVKAAHAFMLKKEGDKFEADAKTANDMREWVVKTAEHESEIKGVQSYFSNAEKESKSDLVGFMTSKEGRETITKGVRRDLREKADAVVRSFDKLFGEYIKLAPSPSSGSSVTTTWYNTGQ